MRPAFLRRAESPMMRRLRQIEYDARGYHALDLVALALGYGMLIAGVVFAAVSLIDWLDGRPAQAWQQVHSLFNWIDGGTR